MQTPFAFTSGKPVIHIGTVFGTPLAVQGWSWLPVNQALFWGLFAWLSGRQHPERSAGQHLLVGGVKMAVSLGSEWCHNIAHVLAAREVGKPVDRLRIILGMPVLLYDEPEHPSITPGQHILRSLGGPVCNALLLLAAKGFRRITPPGSAAREVADTAAGMNTFLTFGSLAPVPVFDGGPILKWSLTAGGHPPDKVKTITKQANAAIGATLAGGAAAALVKKRRLVALVFAFLGALCLAAAAGKMER